LFVATVVIENPLSVTISEETVVGRFWLQNRIKLTKKLECLRALAVCRG